jgi:uncharacterized membrane protein YoaK (UPF0700 family)
VLAGVAGSVDVIGFLGLGGLFVAHITGNLVILAAHVVAGAGAPWPLMISVPVFVAALALARVLAAALERAGVAPLAPLLLLQFALLCAFASICVAAGPRIDSNTPTMVAPACWASAPWQSRTRSCASGSPARRRPPCSRPTSRS